MTVPSITPSRSPPRVIAHMIGVDEGMANQFVEWVKGVLGDGLLDPERGSRFVLSCSGSSALRSKSE